MDFDVFVMVMKLTAIVRYQWCTNKISKVLRAHEIIPKHEQRRVTPGTPISTVPFLMRRMPRPAISRKDQHQATYESPTLYASAWAISEPNAMHSPPELVSANDGEILEETCEHLAGWMHQIPTTSPQLRGVAITVSHIFYFPFISRILTLLDDGKKQHLRECLDNATSLILSQPEARLTWPYNQAAEILGYSLGTFKNMLK